MTGAAESGWPRNAAELVLVQPGLAARRPPAWTLPARRLVAAGCFVCFPRNREGVGAPGDPAWAAAVLMHGRRVVATATVRGAAGAPYVPGLLALREGPVLEAVMRRLVSPADSPADVLLVNATGRDHPRRAGLALHLGALLDVPTVGVTHRPLLAAGAWPTDRRGATASLALDGEPVGCWVRTRAGARPLVAHAAWRTNTATAAATVLATARRARTPEPLRRARAIARRTRAAADG